MTDYEKRLMAYQTAMALARSMRSKGIISVIIAKNTALLLKIFS